MRMTPDATLPRNRFGTGFLAGLAPAIGTLVLLGLALLTLAATRGAADPNDFAGEQSALGMVARVGLSVIAAWYLVSSVWLLRASGGWARGHQQARAVGTLLGLVVSALLVALPVALAIVLPQHPAFGL
jgi:hypothetical protein